MHAVVPVAAGIAVGIALMFIVSSVFIAGNEYRPRPGIHSEKAAAIAAQDNTLQELIDGRDVVIRTQRDWGVAGPDCPMNWCAIVFVGDETDPKKVLYDVSVNVRDEKVAHIYIASDLLIAQTKENVEEVKSLLSRYPDSEAEVQVYPSGKTVTYSTYKTYIGPDVENPGTRNLTVVVETTHAGQVISVYAQCDNEKVTTDIVEFIETTDCMEP